MSSISSSLSSQSGSSTPTNYFNGMSTYASSLNNAISQAVEMASFPIELLQNDVTSLTGQSQELSSLSGDVTNVQSAISTLASDAGNMLSASVSDGSATVTVGSGASANSYTLQVAKLGSYSDALSVVPTTANGLATVSDPAAQNISTSQNYTLTVTNSDSTPPVTTNTPIPYSGGNLNGLVQAINNANSGVQAAVVNVGTNNVPNYVLSLQSDGLGSVTMQLNDGPGDSANPGGTGTNLLTPSGSGGTQAEYYIDGQQVFSETDTVTLAPGVTAQLQNTNTNPATVRVAANPATIGNDLQSFVSAYNTAMTELGNNRGQGTGALAGQSIVYQVTDALQSLANYATGDGAVNSLATLGLTFSDTTGQLSFDQSTFDSATSGQSAALTQFLGSATGGGFLQTATNTMTGMLNPSTGTLTQEVSSITANITSTNSQIASKQAAVTLLQGNLTTQMAAADSMIYELQQQSTEISGIFTAEQDAEMAGA